MLDRIRTDAFVQISAALGIVTSLVTLVTSKQAVVALGVAGVIYSVAAAIFCFREAFSREASSWKGAVLSAAGVGCSLVAAEAVVPGRLFPTWTTRYADIRSFGLIQMAGVLGVLLGGMLLWGRLEERHRNHVQVCPDCLKECPREAHVCHWCGYRWSDLPPDVRQPEARSHG